VAAKPLVRTALVALVLGLVACGSRKKEATPEAGVDLAAIRARRDSIRRVAAEDSITRAKFAFCADSVKAELAKATAKKDKKDKKKPPVPAVPEGMIPPEVLSACGKPPAPKPAQASPATSDSAAHLVGAKPDSTKGLKPKADSAAKAPPAVVATAPAGKRDTTRVEAPTKPGPATAGKDTAKVAAPAQQPAKPALTAKQLQVLRADSIRQAREAAKQDSLRRVAERSRQDSIVKLQRDSVRAESLKVARETEVLRETFTYAGGARDPFASLLSEEKIGPEFNDLLLVGVYLDLRRASNSVAVLRDKTNQKRYKLRVGDRLGRLKVAQIRQTDVVFTVEDIGFERQETLSLRKREDQTP
jgi:hypothetical protein